MDFEKSKVLLKKINALHQAADESMGVSALEKDLMLQYVRDFYESILADKSKTSTKPIQTPTIVANQEPELVAQVKTIPEPQPTIAEPVLAAIEQVPVPAAIPVLKEVKEPSIAPELLELFAESEKDNGSIYSSSKIRDIAQSMGINDKILTINELFKGNQNLFDETVRHLNGLSSFEEAKTYLGTGVAVNLNWSNASKKGKAVTFMNLIRRRYA